MLICILLPCLALACQKPEQPAPVQEKSLVLEAGFRSGSKTSLNGLTCTWTDGDAIVVNGQSSTGIEILESGKKARFTMPLVDAPYHAIYPASAYNDGSYYPSSGYYGTVTVPDVQSYVPGSFDPASAIMVAAEETGPGIDFVHAMSYLRLTVNGGSDSHAIAEISIWANSGEDLSGQFKFDPSIPGLIASGKNGNKLTVDCGAGAAQGNPIVITLPSQVYQTGISMRIKDVKNHYQVIKSQKQFNAEAGKIYETSVQFNPTGTLIDGEAPGSASGKKTRILFVGNSHTLDATDLLPLILNHEGVRNVELTRCYHGGCYLVAYNKNFDQTNYVGLTTWEPGQNFWNGTIEYRSSLRDISATGPFDIIVIQEYSGGEHAWTWSDTEKEAIHGLVSKLREASPDAEFVYFQSHCWATNHDVVQSRFGGSNVTQFETVVRENSSHVMDPAEGYPFKRIISTGALLQNLRTTGLKAVHPDDFCRGDHIHLDYGMPRAAASLLIWKTLITPLTGIQPEGVSFRFTEFYPNPQKYSTPLTDDNIAVVLSAVNAAYNDPYHITDLSSYTGAPQYVDNPGSVCLNDTGVEVKPVAFPVRFPLSDWDGTGCQFLWGPLGIWFSAQPQAFAKWVSVSRPVDNLMYNRGFFTSGGYSVTLNSIWTGDYFEFVIPVKNFRAGTTIRFSAPFYTRQGPCFWYLDYLDGDEWKCNTSECHTWDGAFKRDATFSIGYGTTTITADCTFEHGVPEGFLRFRLRCADGSIQAASSGAVQRSTPNIESGAYSCAFYFTGDQSLSFSMVY